MSIYVDGIKEFVFVIKRHCVVYCEVNADFFFVSYTSVRLEMVRRSFLGFSYKIGSTVTVNPWDMKNCFKGFSTGEKGLENTAVDSSTAELANTVILSCLWSNSDCPSGTFQLLRLGFFA